MASNTDIALFRNDLFIVDGDFGIAYSDQQHISDTIAAFPGWWKEHPQDGVGVLQYLGGSNVLQTLRRSSELQLKSDGYTLDGPVFDLSPSGTLVINPKAVKP